ncbi:MAG TPA: HemK/PrmC family methyltransferase, partial [Chloroflexota bacterium]
MSTVAFSAPTPRSHATDVDGRTVAEGDPATASLDTVEAAHRHGVRVLRAAGVEEPWLDALLLLMEVTRLDKASLLAYPQRRLPAGVADRYVDLLERRARREPTAYILGRCEFYGLEFAVDRRVLIPRPETEMLVDLALEALRPYRPDVARRRVVEVGTGSGAIAVSLLRTVPDLRLTATDCAAEALAVARSNAARLGVADRLELRHGDLLEPVEGSFD